MNDVSNLRFIARMRLVDGQFAECSVHSEQIVSSLWCTRSERFVGLGVLLFLEPRGVRAQFRAPGLVDVHNGARITTVLRRQDVLGHELVQIVDFTVHVDAAADLLLQERLHKVHQAVHQR